MRAVCLRVNEGVTLLRCVEEGSQEELQGFLEGALQASRSSRPCSRFRS